MALTPKQARFVEHYLVDLNATQAAVRAGYSPKTAEKIGSENLKKPEVRRAIDEAQQRRSERVQVTSDDVLRELLRIATTDIGLAFDEHGGLKALKDIPVDVRRAISSVEVEQLSVDGVSIGTVAKLKFWDKTKSLELLGKHLRLFADKIEHSGNVTLEQLVTASIPDATK
jgi:phage terminase small subunit